MCDCENRIKQLLDRTSIIAGAIEQLSDAIDALDSRTRELSDSEWGSAINTPGNITEGYPGWD